MVHIMCSFFKRKKKDMEKIKFITSLLLILLLPYINTTLSGPKAKKHFVLAHTACHAAWSWYKIEALMRSSGHNVTALDLGASGINPKQAPEIPHFSDYLSPLMGFMASLPDNKNVVLAGHSYGGLAISKAMEIFPEKISAAVYLSGLMPGPTLNATTIYTEVPVFHIPNFSHEMICYVCLNFDMFETKYTSLSAISAVKTALDNRVTYDNGPTNPPTTVILGPKFLATNVYQLSPIKDLVLAYTLVRPLYLHRAEDVTKEMVLSSKRYGSVRRVFVVATESKGLQKELMQLMIEKNPPNEVEEIQGSDHETMMSKPQKLFTTLLSIANKYS